jgi:hypothetical protein
MSKWGKFKKHIIKPIAQTLDNTGRAVDTTVSHALSAPEGVKISHVIKTDSAHHNEAMHWIKRTEVATVAPAPIISPIITRPVIAPVITTSAIIVPDTSVPAPVSTATAPGPIEQQKDTGQTQVSVEVVVQSITPEIPDNSIPAKIIVNVRGLEEFLNYQYNTIDEQQKDAGQEQVSPITLEETCETTLVGDL